MNDLALSAYGPGDLRLDSGMKVCEALERAERWWVARGRRQLAAMCEQSDGFVPSGILQGWAWDYLTRDEKLRVVKVWHHMHVRRPDLLGVSPDDAFKLGRGETIQ